jgi:hypothetical protein
MIFICFICMPLSLVDQNVGVNVTMLAYGPSPGLFIAPLDLMADFYSRLFRHPSRRLAFSDLVAFLVLVGWITKLGQRRQFHHGRDTRPGTTALSADES